MVRFDFLYAFFVVIIIIVLPTTLGARAWKHAFSDRK